MRNRIAFAVLAALAVLAPLADLFGHAPTKGFALATQASPAMKVFTSHNGYETFSPRFHIDWAEAGEARSLALTPSVYAQVEGPYNRRNAYGAALSYAPVLSANPATRDMHAAVSRFALCGESSLLKELGIHPSRVDGNVTIRIDPHGAIDPEWQLTYEVRCDE